MAINGEVVNKYMKEGENNVIENAKQIISFRNGLIHSYNNVDDSII